MNHYIYDIETFPNCFSIGAIHHESGTRYCWEISDRRDDTEAILAWLAWLEAAGDVRMVGFNNLHFDWPIVDYLLRGARGPGVLYQKCLQIIHSQDRFSTTVKPWEITIPQVDLFKIHHFDNRAKSTSLKVLEFNMRLESIEDLPFPPGTTLTSDQMQTLVDYMMHDVDATRQFFVESLPAIQLRDNLSERYGRDHTNDNDTRIGKAYFIQQLEAGGVSCFYGDEHGRKQPRQTIRDQIPLADVILPCVAFTHPELRAALEAMRGLVITDTRAATSISAIVDGFRFDFSLGGVHASIESTHVIASDSHRIIDLDVTSYYPSLAIVNGFFPEHLSSKFCEIYAQVKAERVQHPKGSPENLALKLALNGVYGDSNNPYSPFFDPRYTMATTINGQMLIAMLAEWLLAIPGLSMIQANTDGVTVLCPTRSLDTLSEVCAWWQSMTGLELERADYSDMWVRDVNNYLARYVSGKTKAKGAYSTTPEWNQDHSQLVVPKVAVKCLIEGVSIPDTVRGWPDRLDFMRRVKVRGSDRLMWGDEEIQRTSRYYVTTVPHGRPLVKSMPPLPRTPDKPRPAGICKGEVVQVCNRLSDATAPINYEWYIQEVLKLTGPVMNVRRG